MRIHSGEKPHQCKCCDKKLQWGFSRSHKLGQCKKIKCEELKLKCEDCHFLSENQSILKPHALSHQISLVDIMKNLPVSIKEASFKIEDEFQEDQKIFWTILLWKIQNLNYWLPIIKSSRLSASIVRRDCLPIEALKDT